MESLLSFFQDLFVSAETKKLIKAGFITPELKLTDKGVKVMQRMVFEKFREDISRLADEAIAAEKSDK